MIKAVLFDLDGTLADTAPDLGRALNLQLERHGLPQLPAELIRPYASHGARGLLQLGFGVSPADTRYDALREEYLAIYERHLCFGTRLFPGVPDVLDTLEKTGLTWGIVTNKPARFTLPLLEQLGLRSRAKSIVSGDTCPRPKPDPEPILCACREIGLAAYQCLYVGDAERDVAAATAAGMKTLIARYGYIGTEDAPETWNAHAIIDRPEDILAHCK